MIAVVNAHGAAHNGDVDSNAEIVWHEGSAVTLEDNLALEELALRDAGVGLLRFSQVEGLVLEEVADGNLSDTSVFQSRLNHTLLEVAIESQHL